MTTNLILVFMVKIRCCFDFQVMLVLVLIDSRNRINYYLVFYVH